MNFHQEFWSLVNLALTTFLSWKIRKRRKRKRKKDPKTFKSAIVQPIHLVPIHFLRGFLLLFMLFGPRAYFKHWIPSEKSHSFNQKSHQFKDESNFDDSPLSLSFTEFFFLNSVQSPARSQNTNLDIVMQSSDCFQILTIAGPSNAMDYSNVISHGKSILEFSMPFASTVFTNTTFSRSYIGQDGKLAP